MGISTYHHINSIVPIQNQSNINQRNNTASHKDVVSVKHIFRSSFLKNSSRKSPNAINIIHS